MVLWNCFFNNSSKNIYQNIRQNVLRSCCTYVQGQSPEPKVREYFYYIDHQGMVIWIFILYSRKFAVMKKTLKFLQLFLDDTKIKNFTSCFKGEKYLYKTS